MEIQILNVDLEVESSENLQILIDDLGEDVSVLYHGENGSGYNFVSFEIRSPAVNKDIDGLVSAFCCLIENLSPEARLIWDRSFTRKLDAGFSSGNSPRSYQTEIRAETIEQAARIGASIAITIYPESG